MSPPSRSPVGRLYSRFGALGLLKVEVWLLLLIPDHLVVGVLGGIGAPSLVLGVALFLMWLLGVLAPGGGVVRTCMPVRAVLGAFWIITLLSFAMMNLHSVPSDQLLNSERLLITMVAFTGVALMAAEGLRDRSEVIALLRTTVAGVAVMAFIGILQFRPGFDLTKYLDRVPFLTPRGDLSAIADRGGFVRPASTALHPIEFGVIVACTLPFALHLAIYDVSRRKWKRWLPLGLMALAIPISISRSALVVSAVVILCFFAGTTPTLRRKGSVVLLGFLTVIFVGVPGMIGTMKGYFLAGNSDTSIASRTNSYAFTAPYIRHAVLIGRGPGTFLPQDFRWLDNQYLLSLVEVGLLGLVCVIALFTAPFWLGRGMRLRSSRESDRNLGQMFAGAGLGAFVGAATYDALSFPTFTALLALILGMAGAAWSQARAEGRSAPAGAGRRPGAKGVSPVGPLSRGRPDDGRERGSPAPALETTYVRR